MNEMLDERKGNQTGDKGNATTGRNAGRPLWHIENSDLSPVSR